MNTHIHVSVAILTFKGYRFTECVVERAEPIVEAIHVAELRSLAAARLGVEPASMNIISWRRLETPADQQSEDG